MNKFVFDVDGTLTPSRQKIDVKFAAWFEHFATHHAVYFITGSDRDKTIEQVGKPLYSLAQKVYNCSGNDIWEQDNNVYRSSWTLDEKAKEWLEQKLKQSKFPLRTGNHIEERPGCVNFSVVGRNATLGERKLYVSYDEETKERERIANEFNYIFGLSSLEICAQVGGDTGIDIYPMGADKSQIIDHFEKGDKIIFFGDKMEQGGNDYPLARENVSGTNHHVRDWKHTWELLNKYT